MDMSQNGYKLIKKYEGLKLKAYLCPAKVWTIGYGTTKGVKEGMIITEKEADSLLEKDVKFFQSKVKNLVKVGLNQNQFDALISFAYNVGHGALEKSTLLKKLNASNYVGASSEFLKWTKANGKTLVGLQRRRAEEMDLFLR
ncbi:MAG: lysozyme [Cetobacterium sp.]